MMFLSKQLKSVLNYHIRCPGFKIFFTVNVCLATCSLNFEPDAIDM